MNALVAEELGGRRGLNGWARQGPALRGGLLALAAAILFGVSTPLVQRFGTGVGAFATAALLYAGAAVVGALSRRPRRTRGAHRIRRCRAPAGNGGGRRGHRAGGARLGPAAHERHQRLADAHAGSTVHGAPCRVALPRDDGAPDMGGHAAAARRRRPADTRPGTRRRRPPAGDCWPCWRRHSRGALDNTLSRALAERDPSQVVLAKSALGAAATSVLAIAFGESLPSAGAALGPACGGRNGLWPQPAVLSACAAGVRGRAHGLRSSPSPLSSAPGWPWSWATIRSAG